MQFLYSPSFAIRRLLTVDVCDSVLGGAAQLLDGDHAMLVRIELVNQVISLQFPDLKEKFTPSLGQAEVEIEIFLNIGTSFDHTGQFLEGRITRFLPMFVILSLEVLPNFLMEIMPCSY